MKSFNFRKLGMMIIPLAGCLSIIGTGFSLWVFNSDGNSGPQNLSIPLTIKKEIHTGFYDGRSLFTKGIQKQIEENYIFPSMLIFEEGKGLETDLTVGLSFYKKILTDNLSYKYQHYLEDKINITYYRDENYTYEEMLNEGLELRNEIEVEITPKLSEFVTIVENEEYTPEPTAEGGVKCVYDLTHNFSSISRNRQGSEIYNEIYNSDKVFSETNPPDVVEPMKNYNETALYETKKAIFDFAKIFRYTSLDKKPNSVKKYDYLKQKVLIHNTESIFFTFRAYYAPIREVLINE